VIRPENGTHDGGHNAPDKSDHAGKRDGCCSKKRRKEKADNNDKIGTQSLVMGHFAAKRKGVELRREKPYSAETCKNKPC